MQTETPPRAEFEVKLEKKEYIAAALIGARRSGALRSAPLVVVVSLVLLAAGMLTMNWFQATSTILVPVVMCLSCPLLLILFFGVEPGGVRKRAAADFVTFDELLQPATVRLYADNAVTVTPTLTPVSYTHLCGRLSYPNLAADLFLPLYAAAGRRGAYLYCPAASV